MNVNKFKHIARKSNNTREDIPDLLWLILIIIRAKNEERGAGGSCSHEDLENWSFLYA